MEKFMIIATLVAGLLLAAIPNVVWIVGKIISLLAHKRLFYAPFGWTGHGLILALWSIVAYGYFFGRWGLNVNNVEYSMQRFQHCSKGLK